MRPDLEIVPLRGNVPTRIAKLESENLDAVVLACAGLDRLGLAAQICERIATDVLLPAVCQGHARARDPRRRSAACRDRALADPEVALRTAAERAFLCRLEGDCTVPLAVFAEEIPGGGLHVRGLLASLRWPRVLRAEARGPASQGEDAAAAGWARTLSPRRVLRSWRRRVRRSASDGETGCVTPARGSQRRPRRSSSALGRAIRI